MRVRITSLFTFLLLGHNPILADSWMWPQPIKVYSTDSAWMAKIIPVKTGLFKTKGSYTQQYKRMGKAYRKVKTYANGYRLRPVYAFLLPNGSMVYLDEWGGKGYGDNVISIYDTNGQQHAEYGLRDVLDSTEISRVDRTISSIWWTDSIYPSGNGMVLNIRTIFLNESGQKGQDTLVTQVNPDLSLTKSYRRKARGN